MTQQLPAPGSVSRRSLITTSHTDLTHSSISTAARGVFLATAIQSQLPLPARPPPPLPPGTKHHEVQSPPPPPPPPLDLHLHLLARGLSSCCSLQVTQLHHIHNSTAPPRSRLAARGLPRMHHKTLSAYYPRLCTLEEYLSTYDGLVYHSDPDKYRALVSGALCAERPHKLGPFPPLGPVEGSQQDAIDGVLRALGHDVLVLGNRVSRPACKPAFTKLTPQAKRWSGQQTQTAGVETQYVGEPADALRARPWRILRSRIGDAGFRYLFLTANVFLPLGNNCYVQLSGPPMHDLYSARSADARGAQRGVKRKRGESPARPAQRSTTG